MRFPLPIVLVSFAAFACNHAPATAIPDAAIAYPTCTSTEPAQCLDSMSVGQGLTMPFYRNYALTAPNPNIDTAIIVVHGVNRDASNYFYTVMTAAEQMGADTNTLILAPHFQCNEDTPSAGQVYWQCSGDDWAHGFADANGASPPVYSFAVIDSFIRLLATNSVFPNLSRVVVTGLSAGGQFAQRYAETNTIDPLPGVSLEYAVLSPSSYAYLDDTRPFEATCSADGGCSAPFAPVPASFGCPYYDDYPYGLENRSGYVSTLSSSTLQSTYVGRAVGYYVGSLDTLANAAGTDLDTSCEANTQGIDRVARAIGFWNAVTSRYGAIHPLTIVPGCMHSRDCMYYSPELRTLLFPSAPSGGAPDGG